MSDKSFYKPALWSSLSWRQSAPLLREERQNDQSTESLKGNEGSDYHIEFIWWTMKYNKSR